jgi:hypothetical protein
MHAKIPCHVGWTHRRRQKRRSTHPHRTGKCLVVVVEGEKRIRKRFDLTLIWISLLSAGWWGLSQRTTQFAIMRSSHLCVSCDNHNNGRLLFIRTASALLNHGDRIENKRVQSKKRQLIDETVKRIGMEWLIFCLSKPNKFQIPNDHKGWNCFERGQKNVFFFFCSKKSKIKERRWVGTLPLMRMTVDGSMPKMKGKQIFFFFKSKIKQKKKGTCNHADFCVM